MRPVSRRTTLATCAPERPTARATSASESGPRPCASMCVSARRASPSPGAPGQRRGRRHALQLDEHQAEQRPHGLRCSRRSLAREHSASSSSHPPLQPLPLRRIEREHRVAALAHAQQGPQPQRALATRPSCRSPEREGLRAEREPPALHALEVHRAVRVPGRDEVHVPLAHGELAAVAHLRLAAA